VEVISSLNLQDAHMSFETLQLSVLCLAIRIERSHESTWHDPVQAMRVRTDPISCVLLTK
jgi:hypothetical protein